MARTVFVKTLDNLCITLHLLCIYMDVVSFDNKRFETYFFIVDYTRMFVNGYLRKFFYQFFFSKNKKQNKLPPPPPTKNPKNLRYC